MIMMIALLVAVGMVGYAFMMNEDIKMFLLVFFAVGAGLGLLRLFMNRSLRKMKGKGWTAKILFFAVLLGFGLPFQNWFRKEILFGMDSEYLVRSIVILVIGVVFMTAFSHYISRRRASRRIAE